MRRSVGCITWRQGKFDTVDCRHSLHNEMLHTKDYKHFRVGDTEFEGASLACRALPGDTVNVEYGQVTTILKRAEHKNIVGTLELASKVRYGLTGRNYPIFLFTPFSESYPPFYVGCSQKDVSQNVLAMIDFAHWDDGTCPRGSLTHIFGATGEIAVEEEALAVHASPLRWKKLEELVEPEPLSGRPIGITFHVDPAGCRDIDDAITLHPIDAVNMEVSIHIADVASWLRVNPALIDKARAISQTLYRDGTAIKPMFPLELSEGKFSLLPGQDRRVVTLKFIWNKTQQEMSNLEWKLEMIRVSQSFTYHSVTKSMVSGELAEICSGIVGRPVTDSHEWIEQLMLLYNREAAKMLRAAGVGVLRRHAGILQERFEAYQALGLPADRLAMAAGEYCEASAADTQHWGLATAAYCHASSPIRRWSDCANQMILKDIIAGGAPVPLDTGIAQMNARSKAVKAYERDLIFVRAVLEPSKKPLDGIVAEPGRVWVPKWGKIVKADTNDIQAGAAVGIKYFCDATKRNWKRRLVLKIEALGGAKGTNND